MNIKRDFQDYEDRLLIEQHRIKRGQGKMNWSKDDSNGFFRSLVKDSIDLSRSRIVFVAESMEEINSIQTKQQTLRRALSSLFRSSPLLFFSTFILNAGSIVSSSTIL